MWQDAANSLAIFHTRCLSKHKNGDHGNECGANEGEKCAEFSGGPPQPHIEAPSHTHTY